MSPTVAERMIARLGEQVTLRRVNGPGVFVSVSLKGYSTTFAGQPNDTPGGVQQFRQQWIISEKEIRAQGWPGPPRRGDEIIAQGSTSRVLSVDARKISENVAMFWLQTDGQ